MLVKRPLFSIVVISRVIRVYGMVLTCATHSVETFKVAEA